MRRRRSNPNKKNLFAAFFLVLIIGAGIIVAPAPARADLNDDINKQTQAFSGKQGANFGTPRDPREITATIIKDALSLLGILIVAYMVYGGYLILLSGGDSDKVQKGKDTIKNAAIGLALVLSAYSISRFVITKLAVGNTEYIQDYCDVASDPSFYKNNKDPYEQNVPNAVLQQKCAEQKAKMKQ